MAEPTLKRSLSLALLTLYGLGTIVGAGIYVLVAKVAGQAGLYAPLSFLLAALLATFTGFSYAELSARFPKSAGEAVYVQEGLRRRELSLLVGVLIIVTGVVSGATIVKGFVGYLHVFAPVPDALAIILVVLVLGGLAVWGITESVATATAITLIEVGGLLYIVAVGGDSLATLPDRWRELLPPFEAGVWQGILLGAFLAFYAFIGFEDMVNVAEEVRDPVKTLPRAILLALGASTVLYILVALVAVLALPPAELAETRAPLAMIYERSTGQPPTVITLISLFAIINGALIQIVMGARVLYGMSQEGWIPRWLGRVHGRTQTPHLATVLITGILLMLALWFPLVALAKFTSFVILVVFALINVSLLRIKHRDPAPAAVRVYPAWIPWAGFLSTTGFLLYQLTHLLAR